MRTATLAALVLLGACAAERPPIDTSRIGPGALGYGGDADIAAINLAGYSFADTARLYGRPVDAARAVAAVDYLAGQLNTSPRWACLSPTTQAQMLSARGSLRQALSIAPNLPSQTMVDSLLRAANDLQDGDPGAAATALNKPGLPPDMLARLGNVPYLQPVNIATARAQGEAEGGLLSSCDQG